MKKVFLLSVIALLSNCLTAQTRELIEVPNWGDLYSSSELSATDEKEIIAQSSAAELEKIKKGYHEEHWPDGIDGLDERMNKRELLGRYHLYKVATLSSGSVIVVAPAAENKHMPADMQSNKDIYFVLSSAGFGAQTEVTEDIPLYDDLDYDYDYTYTDYSALTTFNEQLSAIITDAAGDFINLWGDDLYTNPEALEQYESLVTPEGANFADIMADINYDYTFWAGYGEFDNQQDARRAYEDLVSKVNNAKPECCTLENIGQTVSDTLTFTSWMVPSPLVYVEVQVGKVTDPVDNTVFYPLYLAIIRSE